MDINEIQKIIPHRYPFLFVDQIVELEPGKRAVGIKNVSVDEWYFQGHFPGEPIMPGVLILEALAQVGCVAVLSLPAHQGKIVLFAGIDKVRFKREVKPGDQLVLTVEMLNLRGRFGKGRCEAKTAAGLVTSAELLFMVTAS